MKQWINWSLKNRHYWFWRGKSSLFQQLHYNDIFQYRKVRYYLKATFSAHISVRFRQLTRTLDGSAVPVRTLRPSLLSQRAWHCCVHLGSPYYDNVRPLCYSDSDAVLLCFDISRPDTIDGALKKVVAPLLHCWWFSKSRMSSDDWFLTCLWQWKAEVQDFCPSTRILLIGCKTDLRTDVCTRIELSNQKQTPVSHEQVSSTVTGLTAIYDMAIMANV